MAENQRPRVPRSFEELKELGDERMAEARQAVAESQRVIHDSAEARADMQRLHDRFHAQPLPSRRA